MLMAFGACTGAEAPGSAAPGGSRVDPDEGSGPTRDLLAVEVPQAPTPAIIRGSPTLVYELHVANVTETAWRLRRITVAGAGVADRVLATLEGGDLVGAAADPGVTADGEGVVLPSGSRAIVYMWLTLEAGVAAPDSLRHRIAFGPAEPRRGEGAVAEPPVVPVHEGVETALGAPLRGADWVAVYDPALERGHRRVLITRGGRERIPARFAIDWMRVDEHGRLFRGSGSRVADWHGHGAEVLAVADARVVGIRSSMEEPETLLSTDDHTLEEGSGNYVSLDLGGGRYVHYEHLEPGSVRVAVGDRVRRGDAVARVGYTGNSGGPHLHMHVSDAPGPLDGEGIPWTLADFRITGTYPSLDVLGQGVPQPPEGGPSSRTGELPPPLAVIDFGGRGR